MKLDLFERAMIAIVVGSIPQREPKKMRLAVRALDAVDSEGITEEHDGQSVAYFLGLCGEDPVEIEMPPEEQKFIVETMLQNDWAGRMLRPLVGLWDRLYPQWEELPVQKGRQ